MNRERFDEAIGLEEKSSVGLKNGSASGELVRTFAVEFIVSNQHGNSLIVFAGQTITLKRNPVRLKENRPKGHPPFGWRQNIFGQLVEDDAEQRIIRRMVELHESGKSLRNIAGHLNEFEIPTKQGGIWQASTIMKILRSV